MAKRTYLKRAHLYWARLPGDKRRPVLLLSPDERNRLAGDVIVIPVSTVLRGGPWHIRLRKSEGGLDQASVLLCEQITTVRIEAIIDRPLGSALSHQRMAQVERAVLRAIGVPIDQTLPAGC
jgi:mRNA-degrading endonuclease toxin of MazEF toxin-antitoxin module